MELRSNMTPNLVVYTVIREQWKMAIDSDMVVEDALRKTVATGSSNNGRAFYMCHSSRRIKTWHHLMIKDPVASVSSLSIVCDVFQRSQVIQKYFSSDLAATLKHIRLQ